MSQKVTGPCASRRVTESSRGPSDPAMCTPWRESSSPAKAMRWPESWLPATSITSAPRAASPTTSRLSRATASPEGELRSYTSPAMTTASGFTSAARRRNCSTQ